MATANIQQEDIQKRTGDLILKINNVAEKTTIEDEKPASYTDKAKEKETYQSRKKELSPYIVLLVKQI